MLNTVNNLTPAFKDPEDIAASHRQKSPSHTPTSHTHREIFSLSPEDNNALNYLCGETDSHLAMIEKVLNIQIQHRSFQFKLTGPEAVVNKGKRIILSYFQQALKGPISSQELSLTLQENHPLHSDTPDLDSKNLKNQPENKIKLKEKSDQKLDQKLDQKPDHMGNMLVLIKTPKINIKPRGQNQLSYISSILNHDINFGIGPAGTGKTFLAIAVAVQELEARRVNKIILVRPAVEAGENLGFLPGDLSQKVDPYLRPMYDALHEMLGADKVNKLIEKQIIEIAPLAFMRGRTLSDAFIILDEAQNSTADQMKMFLTRIGFNSTAVINGDITQVDLPRGKVSGLRHAMQILDRVKGIGFTFFESKDIVRHPLVQKIVDAYEKNDPKHYDEAY